MKAFEYILLLQELAHKYREEVPRRGQLDESSLSIGFSIDENYFLLPIDEVSEVIHNPEIIPIPLAPFWISGIVNQRGVVFPIFDLQKTIFGKKRILNDFYCVVVKNHSEWVGFIIEQLHGLKRFSEEETEEIDAVRKHPFFLYSEKHYTENGIPWLQLNIFKLFDAISGKTKEITHPGVDNL